MGVTLYPPAAEGQLEGKDGYADEDTDGVAGGKVESPMIEEGGTYHALRDIVGETHSAIGHDVAQWTLKACGVEGKEQRRHYDGHKGELVERVDDEHQGVNEGTLAK